jgi:SAM-dependent methyltransferase
MVLRGDSRVILTDYPGRKDECRLLARLRSFLKAQCTAYVALKASRGFVRRSQAASRQFPEHGQALTRRALEDGSMDSSNGNLAEQDRIRSVYQQWHGGEAIERYAWHRREILQQEAAQARTVAPLLAGALGTDLSSARILDVGCGTGGFLRQLISWGADPAKLVGTEYQQDRLDQARLRTAAGVRWHLGSLDFVESGSLDLATAQTVFSSILDQELRRALAAEMWRAVRPGGWCMTLDFRYGNPRNPNVRKVTHAELRQYWPSDQCDYRTLLLAPPIARPLARAPYLATELLVALLPVLRSHFVFMARKRA